MVRLTLFRRAIGALSRRTAWHHGRRQGVTAVLMALVGSWLAICPVSEGALATGTWASVTPLEVPAVGSAVVTLANGDVLVAGGENLLAGAPEALSSCELYNPGTGTWSMTTGALNTARFDASAVLLPDGDVLIAGGENLSGAGNTPEALTSAELFNPATETWTATGSLPTPYNEWGGTMTVLGNGDVVLTGGGNPTSAAVDNVAEYNGATWKAEAVLPQLANGLTEASAVTLGSGNVLVAGGLTLSGGSLVPTGATEIYNVSGNTWTAQPSLPSSLAESGGSMNVLSNGTVLLAGGESLSSGISAPVSAAEIFAPTGPTAGTWTATGSLITARFAMGSAVLSNGNVLVAGGTGADAAGSLEVLASAEQYDPTAKSFAASGTLPTPSTGGTLAALSNGEVLAVGGSGTVTGISDPVASTGLYGSDSAPGFSSGASASFVVGEFNSFTIVTSGSPSPTLSESGSLPPGVTFSAGSNGTGTLSGVPGSSSAGSYPISFAASNSVGSPVTQAFTLYVTAPAAPTPTVTPTTVPASTTPPAGPSVAKPPTVAGYWVVHVNGAVSGHGTVPFVRSGRSGKPVAIVAAPATGGYWIATAQGNVYNLGGARFFGSLARSIPRGVAVTAMVASPDGQGYLLLDSRGGVHPFGDARWEGSPVHQRSHAKAIALAVTPDGGGYLVARSSGAISAYGDAQRYFTGQVRQGIAALAITPDDKGYWAVTPRGHVLTFGDASFFGDQVGTGKVVGFASTPDGLGYLVLSSSGAVSSFGDAPGYGSDTGLAHAAGIALNVIGQ